MSRKPAEKPVDPCPDAFSARRSAGKPYVSMHWNRDTLICTVRIQNVPRTVLY